MNVDKREGFREKLRKKLDKYCDFLELLLAITVGAALIFTAVTYMLTSVGVISLMPDTTWFQTFLKDIFNLVVGIEFIKMLLKPSAENVIEVFVFLVARYLIIDHSSALGILACVGCIILLYASHYALQYIKLKIAHSYLRQDEEEREMCHAESSDLGDL